MLSRTQNNEKKEKCRTFWLLQPRLMTSRSRALNHLLHTMFLGYFSVTLFVMAIVAVVVLVVHGFCVVAVLHKCCCCCSTQAYCPFCLLHCSLQCCKHSLHCNSKDDSFSGHFNMTMMGTLLSTPLLLLLLNAAFKWCVIGHVRLTTGSMPLRGKTFIEQLMLAAE